MVLIRGCCLRHGQDLSQEDVPRLAKEKEIRFKSSMKDEDCEILTEVLQITTTLKSLVWNDTNVITLRNSKFIEALAKNRTVKSLNLTYGACCEFCCGDEDAIALAVVLKENSTIDSISLFSGSIGAEGAAALADALKKNTTLQTINLGYNQIGDEGAKALAGALKVNSSLQELYLKGNRISAEGASALADALKENKILLTLELGVNQISEVGATAMAEALNVNITLKRLSLRDNKIGDGGAASLAEALKDNNNLTTIDLECNKISDDGASALADALKVNSSLQHLYLVCNKISAEGAAAVAEALKDNKSLTKIQLDFNQIGAEGAKALAAALKVNSSLQHLNLRCNKISDEGAVALADALKENKSLTKIELRYNEIGDEGAAAMAEVLKENITLKTLRLASNKIGEMGGNAILNALQQSGNSSIEDIALYWNDVTKETLKKIDEEINRIQNCIRTVAIDGGQVVAEGLAGEPRGDDNDRSSNETGQPTTNTIDAGNAYVGNASDEDAQMNAGRDEDIAAKETLTDTKEQELQSTITRLQRELVEKDAVIAEKDGEIASIKAILKKIGMMVNSKDGDSNNECGEAPQPRHRGTESGDRNNQSQREKELQSEIDSLKEQLKNSRPIETVDLTNEVEPSSATDDDSKEEEPPSKRPRTKSNLAHALEQNQQMVAVKEEAIQRAVAAEANAETAHREKASVEASLRDVQEDLEIQQETTEQVAVTLDTWQGRFDRLYELAAASGVDGAVLRSIREGNNA